MLNIYKAIDIIDVISENSGRTKPWVVLAQTPQGVKPFVVKLFTSQQVDFANSITHEVIGNALAMEFELCVPEMALIDIPEDLAMNKAPHYQIQFSNTDPRLKFATARIPNANTLIKDLPKSFYNKRIEMDTLYAFDNLIRNADRGQNKTNMLVSGNLLHLIDHEMALKQNDISGIDMNEFEIDEKFTKYHLFYSYLKRAIKNTKSQYFNDFTEYLRILNLGKLTPYYNTLSSEGFSPDRTLINDWLFQIQQNSTIFVNKLHESLR